MDRYIKNLPATTPQGVKSFTVLLEVLMRKRVMTYL